MYCKRCGKELDDNARFCDRCGQSVRKKPNNSRGEHIEDNNSPERMDRREAMQNKKNKKVQQKQRIAKKNKKPAVIITLIVIILLLLVVTVIISYLFYGMHSTKGWLNKDESVALNSTINPFATEEPIVNPPTPVPKKNTASQDTEMEDGYNTFKIGAIEFHYPVSFTSKAVSGNVKLSLVEQNGGGTIEVVQEKSAESAAALMKKFAQTEKGEVTYSLAGDGWYCATLESNGIITHRKGLVLDNQYTYYEFKYSQGSSYTEKYKEYIEHMDETFTY